MPGGKHHTAWLQVISLRLEFQPDVKVVDRAVIETVAKFRLHFGVQLQPVLELVVTYSSVLVTVAGAELWAR